jgi:hypothetical protein
VNTEPTCGSPTINTGRPRQACYTNSEPPVGGLVTTTRGTSPSDDRLGSRVPLMITRARAQNSRQHCGLLALLAIALISQAMLTIIRRGEVARF